MLHIVDIFQYFARFCCDVLRSYYYYYYYSRLTALCPGLPRWAGTRKVKPIWILLKQQTVSGSGISRAVCKSAPRSRQITTRAPHQSVFYRPDALPVAQPTVSKHWRPFVVLRCYKIFIDHFATNLLLSFSGERTLKSGQHLVIILTKWYMYFAF